MNTIRQRIERAHDALTLILAGCNMGGDAPLDIEDVIQSVGRISNAIREDLYWLKVLPAVVLDLPAPDMMEIEDKYGVGNEQDHRERIVREALSARFFTQCMMAKDAIGSDPGGVR